MAVINLFRDRHLLTGRVHRARGRRLTLLCGLSRSPEEVRLQPGHRLGVEAVLAQRVGSQASEGDVRSEVPVEGVLVLALDRSGIGLAEAPRCSCRADLGPLHSGLGGH